MNRVMDNLAFDFGGRQAAAASKEGDAQGAGRGETWPEGVVEALTWVRDFGDRVVNPEYAAEANFTADGNAVFDVAAGLDQLEHQFGNSAGALFTTNGTATFMFCADARGPFPEVKCYAKAHNALLRAWPLYTGVIRLMDAPQTETREGSDVEVLVGEAKPIVWDSVDEPIQYTDFHDF